MDFSVTMECHLSSLILKSFGIVLQPEIKSLSLGMGIYREKKVLPG